jgi:membrane dipeptidase
MVRQAVCSGCSSTSPSTKLPKITEALLDRGCSERDIQKILGGDILRVMEEVERARGQ